MKTLPIIIYLLFICTTVYALPEVVDNSTSPYFPEIRNQGIGWCGLFHMVYYNFSYEWSRLYKEVKIFSPRLAWGELNYGTGVDLYRSLMFMIEHGSPEWGVMEEIPLYPKKITNPLAWESAEKHKVETVEYIKMRQYDPCTVPEAIEKAKQALADGHVLTFGTYLGSWKSRPIEDNPTTTLDDNEVGKRAVYWNYQSAGQHGMTLVGYNDTLWVDCNNNNTIDEGELGAFRIANSYGKDWGDNGFCWMAYDAMFSESRIEGAPTDDVYRFGAIFTAFYKLVLPKPPIPEIPIGNWSCERK